MAKDKILYFAYGSNLDLGQIQKRCPSARFMFRACMKNHRLDFTRKSIIRDCGVADAVPEQGANVCGVVYEIDLSEIGDLDVSEGYKPDRQKHLNSYNREPCQVIKDDDEAPVNVETYFAVKQSNPPRPNKEYIDIIIQGTKHWKLPTDYIEKLESFEVQS